MIGIIGPTKNENHWISTVVGNGVAHMYYTKNRMFQVENTSW